MSKKVLIYYPPNKRSIAIETLCRAVVDAGHKLIVLTLTEKGPFHEELEKRGIKTFTHYLIRKSSWKYFYAQARYLVKFCKAHKVDYVWSHLQEGNIIGVLAQPFLKSKLIAFRHHSESAFYAELGAKFGMTRNKKEVFLDRVINRLAKLIVVPSSGVWYGMEKYEKCNMKKVRLMPYIYDFSSYQKPDTNKVMDLREKYKGELRLIMISRMVPTKQHQPVFEAVKKLNAEGLSLSLIVMDDGPLRKELEKFIEVNQLSDIILLVGFKDDFVNYMAAADLLIHPSVTEASSNVVKEMGLLKKAVAVCAHVGDFDDYIQNGKNGYMLDNDGLNTSIEAVIRDAYEYPEKLKLMGEELNKDVLNFFTDSKQNRERFLNLLN
jgi:glycosyltransferase involved in cell wall biosynthesis